MAKKDFSFLTSHLSTPRGETLIEALGALAIISVVVTAAAIAVTTALNNAAFNKNQTQATKYAQEGVEVVRQIRNANYTQFRSYNGLYCLADNQSDLGSVQSECTQANIGNFVRSVVIEQTPGCRADVPRVAVTVAFTDGTCRIY